MRDRPHVLVVERDASERRYLGIALADFYDVSVVSDAIQAIGEARRWRPDVVVLAWTLPGGDASLVVQRLRSLPTLATVPVILVSDWDERWSWEELLEMDAEFLPKPVERHELLDEIAYALRR